MGFAASYRYESYEGTCAWDGTPPDDTQSAEVWQREAPCAGDASADGPDAVPFCVDDVSPQELGAEGERIAASYLGLRGWEVLAKNWVCPYGEVDILARDEGTPVLVEVKTRLVRNDTQQVYPELAVDATKRSRYRRMAAYYQAMTGADEVRFDVVAISIVAERMARIHHLVDVFGGEA